MNELVDHCKFLFVDSCGLIWNWSFLRRLFSLHSHKKCTIRERVLSSPKQISEWDSYMYMYIYILQNLTCVRNSFCSPSCYWTCVLLNDDLTKSCLVAAVERLPILVVYLATCLLHGHCFWFFYWFFLLHHYSLQCMLWMCVFYTFFFADWYFTTLWHCLVQWTTEVRPPPPPPPPPPPRNVNEPVTKVSFCSYVNDYNYGRFPLPRKCRNDEKGMVHDPRISQKRKKV